MKKYMLAASALFAIGILGFSLASAGGFGKGFFGAASAEDREAMKERHTAMKEAIESNDYETWATHMQEAVDEMQSMISQETFDAIRERHAQKSELRTAIQEAKDSGDWSKVEELKEEYGLEDHRGFGKKNRWGHKAHMQETIAE